MKRVLVAACVAISSLTASAQALPTSGPLPESDANIGFKTPAEALSALRKKPGAIIREQQGWTIVEDKESEKVFALWSFAPKGHPSYPSVVKRIVYEENGQVLIRMGVICGAAKEPCDALVRDFQALNDRMKADMANRAK